MGVREVRRLNDEGLLEELRRYEERYDMPSHVFVERWRSGDTSLDKPGYFAWAGLCRMAIRRGILSGQHQHAAIRA